MAKKKEYTYADEAKAIQKRFPRRETDPIEKRDYKMSMEKLMKAQEDTRAEMGLAEPAPQMASGGRIEYKWGDYIKGLYDEYAPDWVKSGAEAVGNAYNYIDTAGNVLPGSNSDELITGEGVFPGQGFKGGFKAAKVLRNIPKQTFVPTGIPSRPGFSPKSVVPKGGLDRAAMVERATSSPKFYDTKVVEATGKVPTKGKGINVGAERAKNVGARNAEKARMAEEAAIMDELVNAPGGLSKSMMGQSSPYNPAKAVGKQLNRDALIGSGIGLGATGAAVGASMIPWGTMNRPGAERDVAGGYGSHPNFQMPDFSNVGWSAGPRGLDPARMRRVKDIQRWEANSENRLPGGASGGAGSAGQGGAGGGRGAASAKPLEVQNFMDSLPEREIDSLSNYELKDIIKDTNKSVGSPQSITQLQPKDDRFKQFLPSMISGATNILGNLGMAAMARKNQPRVNTAYATPEMVNLDPQAEMLRRDATTARNIASRNARMGANNPGSYLGNLGAASSGIATGLGRNLTGLYGQEALINNQNANKFALANQAAQTRANMMNAQLGYQGLQDQLGYYSGALGTIPGMAQEWNMMGRDNQTMNWWNDYMNHIGRNYKIGSPFAGGPNLQVRGR